MLCANKLECAQATTKATRAKFKRQHKLKSDAAQVKDKRRHKIKSDAANIAITFSHFMFHTTIYDVSSLPQESKGSATNLNS